MMDGDLSSQETLESTEMTVQTDSNNNSNETDEQELESKDQGREPPAGKIADGQGVMEVEEKKEKEPVAEQKEEEDGSDKPQTSVSKHVQVDAGIAEKDPENPSSEATSGQKDEEREREEDKKSEQVGEVKSCENGRQHGGEMKNENNKEEQKANEAEKDINEKAVKGEDKKKQAKGVDVETKEKGTVKEVEKQGKPKRKSAPSSSLSRPRPSARSIRAAAKNDIIAKFQQGAPEMPIPRNFKIQRSSTALTTGASIKQKILQWCHNKTRNYEGVNVENFSSSWCNGLAFCALIHRFFPDAFDYGSLNPEEREKNFTLAFQTAESLADCCPLLEVNDMLMMGNNPDPMCVFTYVQSLCHSLSKIEKERREKEKEEKDKAGDEGEMKEEAGAGEVSPETDEGGSTEKETTESQEEQQGDVTKTGEIGEEPEEPHSCETEGDEASLVKAESEDKQKD